MQLVLGSLTDKDTTTAPFIIGSSQAPAQMRSSRTSASWTSQPISRMLRHPPTRPIHLDIAFVANLATSKNRTPSRHLKICCYKHQGRRSRCFCQAGEPCTMYKSDNAYYETSSLARTSSTFSVGKTHLPLLSGLLSHVHRLVGFIRSSSRYHTRRNPEVLPNIGPD